MSLKRNMVFGIVGLLIPIFVLLYAVVYITLEKNMYHNAKRFFRKVKCRSTNLYDELFREGSRSGYAWSEFTFNCVVFSEAYGCPCADDWEEWRCCCRYTKGALLHRNIDIESSLKGRSLTFLRRRSSSYSFVFKPSLLWKRCHWKYSFYK